MRHPNGYGSVVFLGENRRKPYAIRVTKGWDDDGKQIYSYLGYYADKEAALVALAANSVTPISPKSNMTFAELYEEWNPIWFRSIKEKLQGNYKNAFTHFAALHKVRFADIRTTHMQKIIDDLDKGHSTKQKMKILAGLLFNYAIENDICIKNYAKFIKLEKNSQNKKKEIFTDLEIETLKKNDNIQYVSVILMLIYTGFRINELFSLTKFSVDLKNATIVGGLKTEAGENRTVPISPKILKYVVSWYNNATDWLVFRDDGKKMPYNHFLEHHYYPILESLGIPRKTPHIARHTCATLMARAGMDPLAIQLIMGHSNYSFTADTYTHTDTDFLKKEMAKLDKTTSKRKKVRNKV